MIPGHFLPKKAIGVLYMYVLLHSNISIWYIKGRATQHKYQHTYATK